MPMDESNEVLLAVARAWMDAGWGKPDREAFMRVHADDFADRSAAGRPPDRDGFWQGVVRWAAAFADLVVTTDDLVASPARGMVTVRWSAVGTHRGAHLGYAPTARRIRFNGIEIIRIAGGRVCERWGEWNGMEILEQLRG